MSDSRRWNVFIWSGTSVVRRYNKVFCLLVKDGVLSFYTEDHKLVITTLPYHAEEVKV